jgi:hypothetical protein
MGDEPLVALLADMLLGLITDASSRKEQVACIEYIATRAKRSMK